MGSHSPSYRGYILGQLPMGFMEFLLGQCTFSRVLGSEQQVFSCRSSKLLAPRPILFGVWDVCVFVIKLLACWLYKERGNRGERCSLEMPTHIECLCPEFHCRVMWAGSPLTFFLLIISAWWNGPDLAWHFWEKKWYTYAMWVCMITQNIGLKPIITCFYLY